MARLPILLNIMFHAPMGRFPLELIYCFTFIFHRRPIQHLRLARLSILLNIMFQAPVGRFQLELIYCFTFIFHHRPIQHLKCCINKERPTGKKHTNIGWDDGGK